MDFKYIYIYIYIERTLNTGKGFLFLVTENNSYIYFKWKKVSELYAKREIVFLWALCISD